LYLNAQATYVIVNTLSDVVTFSITPFRSAHEIWTKLQEKYGVYKIIEDDCISSTSDRDELSSTSPNYGKTQGNDMVCGDETCNGDSMLIFDDPSCLSHCNASSLDLNTCFPINSLHACVDRPCISCVSFLNKSHDDMLALSSCHNINSWDFYFCALRSLVVLSFPQPLSFSLVLPKPLSETLTRSSDERNPI
jgi:hypothetical protein